MRVIIKNKTLIFFDSESADFNIKDLRILLNAANDNICAPSGLITIF